MTEQETAAKLKARLSQWQTYMEQPQSAIPEGQPFELEAHSIHAPGNAEPIYDACELYAAPTSSAVKEQQADPDPLSVANYINSVVTRCEAQISDMQRLVEYEREQSRHTVERLAREMQRHEVAFQPSPMSYAAGETTEPIESLLEKSRRQRLLWDKYRSKIQTLLLAAIVLMIAGSSAFLALWLEH